MLHLSEQVKQVIVKSHGQHIYLEETMTSTQHVLYTNTSLSSHALCPKHYIQCI